MLELLNQLPSSIFARMCIIQVDVLVPGGDKQLGASVGCVLEGRDRVAGSFRELKLYSWGSN